MSALTEVVDPRRDQDRWLVEEASARWERARVVGVLRYQAATTLRLELPTTRAWLPGQYYLVRLAVDSSSWAMQQAYSLSSSPFPPSSEIEITVRPVEGGRVSPLLAREVETGDQLEVRGPYGLLTWTEVDGGPLVLIGGGSGVAPLVSIVRYATTRGVEVPTTMLCSNRARTTALLVEILEGLRRANGCITVAHTFTRSPWDPYARYHRRIDAAMLEEVINEAGIDASAASFYVAGPGDMVAAVRESLGALGITWDAIYSEDHA